MYGRALGGKAGSSLTAAQVFAVADATRRRIERDLHDGLQQQLVVLALRVRAVEAMVPAELVELRAELSGVVDEHTNLLDQLREIAHGIHPAVLSEDGLEPALKTLARRSPIPVELKVHLDARLPEEVELAAYYIVAEALTNTAKYSRASLAHVLVETRGRTLRIAGRDVGVGGADPARGTGLLGLTQRAEAIGGTVSLHSPPAAGTLLDAELPLGEQITHGPTSALDVRESLSLLACTS
jgi:signal transduction histidine kinase